VYAVCTCISHLTAVALATCDLSIDHTRLAEKVITARLGPSLALLRHICPPLWLKQAT
jgi:hypothetical protein